VDTSATAVETAFAMHDPFIFSCYVKYVYNYVQPETFINQYIDKDWVLLIQTPPAHEYPGGHSVASTSAVTLVTQMVDDKYIYRFC